jgi:epoxyqueuosine reductase
MSGERLVGVLRSKAEALGFELFGVASAGASERREHWLRWLAAGHAGEMAYLSERLDERLDPGVLLPGAKSAICLARNYYVPLAEPAPEMKVPGRVARYALGEDYHDWIKPRLYDLADYLRELVPGSKTKCGVDSAPIPERELSARAGVGWVGKNTMVIHPRLGSYLFLATVLTTVDLPTGTPMPDRCGSCTRCLEACPTEALSVDRPYEMRASECISYLTIEHRSEIPKRLKAAVGDWLFGCDICQEVCPYNTPERLTATEEPKAKPRIPSGRVDAAEVLKWTEVEWHPFSRRTAIRRLGLELFRRNAGVVEGGG